MVLVFEPPENPIFQIFGLAFGKFKLFLDHFYVVLELFFDWQVKKILSDIFLTR